MTLRQLSVKLDEGGLSAEFSKPQPWLKGIDARTEIRRVTPELSFPYTKDRVDFYLDQVYPDRRRHRTYTKLFQVDET